MEYQYGDWLRASNGRNRSPSRRRNAPHGDELGEEEDNQVAGRSGMGAMAKMTARVFAPNNVRTNELGNNEIHGAVTDIQPPAMEEITQVSKCMAEHIPSLMHGEDLDINLNVDKDNGLEEGNKEAGLSISRPNKQMAKWTRFNRMEVRPNESNKSNSLTMLGKQSVEDPLFLSCKTRSVT
nr:hypothetical protein CFP56_32904 [Quercus suber]